MTMLIVYAVVAVGISFVCSVLEAVLLSIPPSYVATQQHLQTGFARRLLSYKRDVDRPLAAILTLNTFAHTIGAAGVGAEAAHIWGSQTLGLVSAVMTVIILIASEIIPKTIGAVYWRGLCHPTIETLRVLIVLLWPVIILCAGITRLLRRGGDQPVLQRGDFRNLADAGHRFGVLRGDERIIIANLLNFEGLTVADVMTPRERLVAHPASTPARAIGPNGPAWWTTRILIHQGADLDSINGYVLKEDVLEWRLRGLGHVPIGSLRRPVLSISSEATLHSCYALLAGEHAHIALVRDAAGLVVGVVTMEDLTEAMFGVDIDDEDEPDPDKQPLQRGRSSKVIRRSGTFDQVDDTPPADDDQVDDEPPAADQADDAANDETSASR